MNKNRLQIYLCDLVHDFLPGNFVLPLNVGLLAAHLNQKFGNEVKTRLFKSPARLFEVLKSDGAPHVIGLSNYSWNSQLNIAITQKIKKRYPETIVVMGGPLISPEPDGVAKFLRKYSAVDYYCVLEGEIPLGNLIEYFLSKGKCINKDSCDEEIHGVAYLSKGQLVYPIMKFMKGVIEDSPSPYLTGVLDEFLQSPLWVPLLETNRGCPYLCNFCAWGVATMNSVRKFPLDRVFEEIRYVAKKSPSPRWMFADANFGMQERDVEIAREVRSAAEKYGTLKSTLVLWAKNSSKRTLRISQILGPLIDTKVSVQSMDEEVLKSIKRGNIKLSSMTDLLSEFRKKERRVGTDVLVGLTGQSLESYLNTLREVFDLHYDFMDCGYTVLFAGAEMDTDECRQTYDIKSKYRMMSSSYGIYDGDEVVECEEIVRSSKDISEDEMQSVRLLNFFIVAFWNVGMAKPLLTWMQQKQGINPLDVFVSLAKGGLTPSLDKFMDEFNQEAQNEWFDTEEELIKYHKLNFTDLLEKGFLKLDLKFAAKLLLDRQITKSFLDAIAMQYKSEKTSELAQFCLDSIYFMDSPVSSKECSYSVSLITALKEIWPIEGDICRFEMKEGIEEAINFELKKYKFDEDPVRALSITLEGPYSRLFLYNFKFMTLQNTGDTFSANDSLIGV